MAHLFRANAFGLGGETKRSMTNVGGSSILRHTQVQIQHCNLQEENSEPWIFPIIRGPFLDEKDTLVFFRSPVFLTQAHTEMRDSRPFQLCKQIYLVSAMGLHGICWGLPQTRAVRNAVASLGFPVESHPRVPKFQIAPLPPIFSQCPGACYNTCPAMMKRFADFPRNLQDGMQS